PWYVKLELRAMTKSQRERDRPVTISSTIPSAKYSCSGSPLRFSNGSTAIDGLSGGDSFGGSCDSVRSGLTADRADAPALDGRSSLTSPTKRNPLRAIV